MMHQRLALNTCSHLEIKDYTASLPPFFGTCGRRGVQTMEQGAETCTKNAQMIEIENMSVKIVIRSAPLAYM